MNPTEQEKHMSQDNNGNVASTVQVDEDLNGSVAADLDIEIELETAETSYSFSEPRPTAA
jgi:hypothetical protein